MISVVNVTKQNIFEGRKNYITKSKKCPFKHSVVLTVLNGITMRLLARIRQKLCSHSFKWYYYETVCTNQTKTMWLVAHVTWSPCPIEPMSIGAHHIKPMSIGAHVNWSPCHIKSMPFEAQVSWSPCQLEPKLFRIDTAPVLIGPVHGNCRWLYCRHRDADRAEVYCWPKPSTAVNIFV